jgi:hypothetical protein
MVAGRCNLMLMVLFNGDDVLEAFGSEEVRPIEGRQTLETAVAEKGCNRMGPYFL